MRKGKQASRQASKQASREAKKQQKQSKHSKQNKRIRSTVARLIQERRTLSSRFPSFLPIRLVHFTLKRPREAQNDLQNDPQNSPQNDPQMRPLAEAVWGVVWGGSRGHFWRPSGPHFRVTSSGTWGNYVSKIRKLGKSRSSGQSRNQGID